MLSRSGETCIPRTSTSSPTLPTTVTSTGSAARTRPRRKRAPPTPPERATILTCGTLSAGRSELVRLRGARPRRSPLVEVEPVRDLEPLDDTRVGVRNVVHVLVRVGTDADLVLVHVADLDQDLRRETELAHGEVLELELRGELHQLGPVGTSSGAHDSPIVAAACSPASDQRASRCTSPVSPAPG